MLMSVLVGEGEQQERKKKKGRRRKGAERVTLSL